MYKNQLEKSENAGFKFPIDFSKSDPNKLLDAFKIMVDAKKEYDIVKMQENTKRYAIDADLKKFFSDEEKKRNALELFEKEFSNRSDVLKVTLDGLKTALEKGDNDIITKSLDAIVSIIKENPLKELDKIGQAFSSGGELVI